MLENRTISILNCVDDNLDEMRVVESFCFNTKVLNIKCFNSTVEDHIMTEIVLDKERATELRDCLDKWIGEV
ncbi:hypothetical protein ACWO4B_003221 [Clostridium sporogenes]